MFPFCCFVPNCFLYLDGSIAKAFSNNITSIRTQIFFQIIINVGLKNSVNHVEVIEDSHVPVTWSEYQSFEPTPINLDPYLDVALSRSSELLLEHFPGFLLGDFSLIYSDAYYAISYQEYKIQVCFGSD